MAQSEGLCRCNPGPNAHSLHDQSPGGSVLPEQVPRFIVGVMANWVYDISPEGVEMTARSSRASPQVYARIGGVLDLVITVTAIFAEVFVRDRLTVSASQ
jgi:hypothetical protein